MEQLQAEQQAAIDDATARAQPLFILQSQKNLSTLGNSIIK